MKSSDMSPLIYNLDDSLIPMARNKYELSFSSSVDFGGSASFDLMRVGLMNAIILKLRVTGVDKTAESTSPNIGGFYNMIKNIKISSHNKTLMQLNKNNIQQRLARMPQHVKEQIYSSSQFAGVLPNDHDDNPRSSTYGTRAGTVGYWNTDGRGETTGYLYIPFPIFEDLRTACAFNMEFLENLSLQIDFDSHDQLLSQVSSAAAPKIDTDNSKVIISYYDIRNDDLKAFENANYKVDDANLSLVLRSYYSETSPAVQTIDGDATNESDRVKTFSIPIQCRNLITAIYVRVRNESVQQGLEGVPVKSISLNLDGKQYFKYDAEELQLISGTNGGVVVPNNALTHASYKNDGTNKNGFDNNENFYEIRFDVTRSNAFSSALSARSVGQPELKVEVMAINNNPENYKVFVECEHISILSISPTDGKITTGQNL
tara:strand:- start:2377 stop:3669 length:1293 start_codon:yes stop_codon:yes gene_type:complete